MNTAAASEPATPARPYVPATALAVGIVLVLVAQFAMDSLADGNSAWHWLQHATLFVGGLLAGGGVLRLYQLGNRPS